MAKTPYMGYVHPSRKLRILVYIYIVYVIYTYIYIYISKYVCNIGHEIIPAFHGAMFISQLDPIHGYIDSTDATVPGIEIQRQGLET